MKNPMVIATALLFGVLSVFGADYAQMSTDALLNLRGTLRTQEERNALHQELQNRYQTMTEAQKQMFNSRPANRMGKGMGPGQGQGMGQGKGMGNRGGM